MLAALILGLGRDGKIYVTDEIAISGLTLSEAALHVSSLCKRAIPPPEFAVCSPDLWNRRQDSGRSGFEIMQRCDGMPPMTAADDRRVAGWRMLREFLSVHDNSPNLFICSNCQELIRCLPALLYDKNNSEDASGEPHSITHAPEALRYGVMARTHPTEEADDITLPFTFKGKKSTNFFD
jgi:phage terminase large subunit